MGWWSNQTSAAPVMVPVMIPNIVPPASQPAEPPREKPTASPAERARAKPPMLASMYRYAREIHLRRTSHCIVPSAAPINNPNTTTTKSASRLLALIIAPVTASATAPATALANTHCGQMRQSTSAY